MLTWLERFILLTAAWLYIYRRIWELAIDIAAFARARKIMRGK
jgi:hypothetical protein